MRTFVLALVCNVLLAAGVGAQERPATQAGENLVFVVPADAPDSMKIFSQSRGVEGDLVLLALSPDEAVTTQRQPTLFWYLSTPTTDKIRFTLTKAGQIEPVLELELPGDKAGIAKVSLAEHKVTLEPGASYKWGLGVKGKPKGPGVQVLVRCEEANAGLVAALQRRSNSYERAKVYFRESCWCDGFAVLSDDIDAHPGDRKLREQRARLLEQVRLSAVSDWEKKAM